MPTPDWPALDWPTFEPTFTALHMRLQIVGKTVLMLTPLQNHWWNITLRVTPRGLTTPPMPIPNAPGQIFQVAFDLRAHELIITPSNAEPITLPLRAQSVSSFFADYKSALASLNIPATIHPMPVELANPIRFDLDTKQAPYDHTTVEAFHQILIHADTIFRRFSTGFLGKISPVHFFWGAADLCVTRFSGRPASGPPRPDPMQQEAYSHEVISAGFWAGNGGLGYPAFYAYAAPNPPALAHAAIYPGTWNAALGEFILPYEEARTAPDPTQHVLNFLQSTYTAAADAAAWPRTALERPMRSAPIS